jgi:hypothetical protein
LQDASGASTTARFFCFPFDIRQLSPAKIPISSFTRSESAVALLIYLNPARQSAGSDGNQDPPEGVQSTK